jgi:aminoglycoside 3-N-acetyltransferase
MSGRIPVDELPLITKTVLVEDLAALGVARGGAVMVHTSMRALGWIVGGPDTVVASLLQVVGETGTIIAYAGWDQDPYHLGAWPASIREAARREFPPFDPAVSEASRDHGRIPERMRTWPGSVRGPHPEASMVAIGKDAGWLVRPHPDDDPYGAGTPLARLVEIDGSVLMLGAPLGTVTLLHHAETIAPIAEKRRTTYEMPIIDDGRTLWRTYHDIDTSDGAFDYPSLGLGVDPFERIVHDALDVGIGVAGSVGASRSVLLPAGPLVEFAVAWLVERFGG